MATKASAITTKVWKSNAPDVARRKLDHMPRPPRVAVPHGLYHVTARGNRRQSVFRDDGDRRVFLALVDEVVRRLAWRVHGYCLMQNHYHLVVETPGADLSAGMQRLNGRFAQWFNDRHELDGHLFQGRFHSVLIESDWHLVELSRYLALNPVRAGLCPSPRGWRWSSYRGVLGLDPPATFLDVRRVLNHFGRDLTRARDAFHNFVENGASALRMDVAA
jgi:putative transposase